MSVTRRPQQAAAHEGVHLVTEENELAARLQHYWSVSRGELERLCLRWSRGHRSDAEDLLSEAILRAAEAERSGSQEPANPRAWLATVIANLGRDRLRARGRETLTDYSEEEPEFVEATLAVHASTVRAKDDLAELARCIVGLTPVQRHVLLAHGLGETYREIARRLQVSEASARKQAQLARNVLRASAEP